MLWHSPTRRAPFVASLLVVCMLYQMGACPCGCIEHNYWLQAVGLAGDDHQIDSGETDSGDHRNRVCANEHDCVGVSTPLFLNNASVTKNTPPFARQLDFVATLRMELAVAEAAWRSQERGPPLAATPPLRATLQVFLI